MRRCAASLPEIDVHHGTFLATKKFAGLVHQPQFRPVLAAQMP
jgi:hypothetical protein